MNTRLRAWPSGTTMGVGPLMVVLTIVYIIVAAAFAAAFPGLRIGALHTGWAQGLGAALLVFAGVIYVPVITAVRGAAENGRLLTTGLFAYVRNPIYAAFIFMVCPGVALIAASWPALFTPLVAYALYRALIPREEAMLRSRFGEEYAAYRRCVGGVVPRLRRRGWQCAGSRPETKA